MQIPGGNKRFGNTLPVPTRQVASLMRLKQMQAASRRLFTGLTAALERQNAANPAAATQNLIDCVGTQGKLSLGRLSPDEIRCLREAQDEMLPLLDEYSGLMGDQIRDADLGAQIKLDALARGLSQLPMLESAHDANGSYSGAQLRQELARANAAPEVAHLPSQVPEQK